MNVSAELAPKLPLLLYCICVFEPPGVPPVKVQGVPLAYNKLSVLTLPALTLLVTDTLVNVPKLVIFG